jgi:hypothetical protein
MYDPKKAQQYLKPGEMEMLLSPIDRAVYTAITERMPGKRIEFKTGISKMATVLAVYRLVALGLIEERPGRLDVRPRKRRSK